MSTVFAFRNKAGNLGIFQKDGNTVRLYIESDMFPVSSVSMWSDWVSRVVDGYQQGDIETPTIESIKFFLARHAESVNIDILDIHEAKHPGCFYPRIAMENISFNYISSDFYHDIRAYKNMQNYLDDLFGYIEPSLINFKSYGSKIREMLILACTEIEYLLLKLLLENGYPKKAMYKTSDYVKCNKILKLDEFEVMLARYPNMGKFRPFYGWSESCPTKSLAWYYAYNSVKHNRGDNIESANLENLLNAISAIHVLLESQYGLYIFQKWKSLTDDKSIFQTTRLPVWKCSELAVPVLFDEYDVKAGWNDSRKYFDDNPK